MSKLLLQSVLLFAVLTLLTGVVYPLAVTAAAQLCCARPAGGSLLYRAGQLIGSELLGQPFDQPKYFWSRPSATTPQPYNGQASSGSNLGPTNSAQIDAVTARVKALQDAGSAGSAIPVDLVTASASGLDPHISPAAAAYQLPRVAAARGLSVPQLQALLAAHTEGRQWGIFGEPRVNVLQLNLALDALSAPGAH